MPTIRSRRGSPPSCPITVTLPDGSSRQVADGAPVRAPSPPTSRPDSPRPRWPRWSTTSSSTSTFPLAARRARPDRHRQEPGGAGALLATRRPTCWPPPSRRCIPGVQCGIGPAIDDGFFYDFVVPQPFVPEDLERIEAKMRELAAQDLVFERQMWDRAGGDRLLRRARRAAQGAADRGEDGRPAAGLGLHDQGPRHVRGLLRRPARAVDRRAQGVQADHDVERLLEGRREEPADAALYGTAFLSQKELDEHLARIEEAKKRDHRKVGKELGLFTFHPLGARARRSGWPRARRSTTRCRLHARRAASPPATSGGEDADRLQQGAVGDVRPLVALPENMFLVKSSDGEEMGLKPMNCPGHYPAVRQRDAQLPGLAAALSRADAAAPQRGLRRARRA